MQASFAGGRRLLRKKVLFARMRSVFVIDVPLPLRQETSLLDRRRSLSGQLHCFSLRGLLSKKMLHLWRLALQPLALLRLGKALSLFCKQASLEASLLRLVEQFLERRLEGSLRCSLASVGESFGCDADADVYIRGGLPAVVAAAVLRGGDWAPG